MSSSPVQVVYVVQGNEILTYDVDPNTLTATQVGTLTVTNAANLWTLIPSPNGHFLYFIADDAQLHRHLWVFPTDANGAPMRASEEIEMDHLFWLAIDPVVNYAYLVVDFPTKYYYNDWAIHRYVINPVSGSLSQPVTEATYKEPNGAEGTEECWVWIDGFNAHGTQMYDDVSCSYHGGGSDTYYERTRNPQTGALGPDQQVYGWNNWMGGAEYVQFIGTHMFDFVVPNDYQQGINSVNIYPIVPNTSKPIVQCTAQMLEACGYSTGRAHPSGNYVFMNISPNTFQIDRVEWGAKKIVDTGNYLLNWSERSSPDGTLVYGVNAGNPGYLIQINGFDTNTGAVTPGGTIWVSSNFDPFFTAQRQ